jgi:hypothetical protein
MARPVKTRTFLGHVADAHLALCEDNSTLWSRIARGALEKRGLPSEHHDEVRLAIHVALWEHIGLIAIAESPGGYAREVARTAAADAAHALIPFDRHCDSLGA